MLTPKQIAERLTGIGSSDSSAVLGVNPYRTADDVFQEKLGKPGFEGNEATYWGDVMEPIIRKQYAKRTGFTVRHSKKMDRHPDYDYLIAHVDGTTYRDDVPGVVEIKTCRFAPKDWSQHYHWCQLQHAMKVREYSWGDLVVLIGGNELKIMTFQRDDEFISAMLQAYQQFWNRVLDARKDLAA